MGSIHDDRKRLESLVERLPEQEHVFIRERFRYLRDIRLLARLPTFLGF